MVEVQNTLEGVTARSLEGFFVGWPSPPDPTTRLRILQASYAVAIAIDGDRVVGFANAISDGLLSAYIPLLEVLPSHQKQGIGKRLIAALCEQLDHLYMVDLVCDETLREFYEPLGFRPLLGMARRNYSRQNASLDPPPSAGERS